MEWGTNGCLVMSRHILDIRFLIELSIKYTYLSAFHQAMSMATAVPPSISATGGCGVVAIPPVHSPQNGAHPLSREAADGLALAGHHGPGRPLHLPPWLAGTTDYGTFVREKTQRTHEAHRQKPPRY